MRFFLKIYLEPAMLCRLAVLIYLCGDRGKVKDPRYMQKRKDSRISMAFCIKSFSEKKVKKVGYMYDSYLPCLFSPFIGNM